MRFLLTVLLIAALSFIAGIFLPWWSIAIVSLVAAFFLLQSVGAAFLAGFLGIFLLWSVLAFWIDTQNSSILSHRIAQLFPLNGSSVLLILVTALVGGLVAGFAAMAGTSLRPSRA